MRRPSPWRGALATAAALMLTFGVVRLSLPGWDGNVWNLTRYTQYRLGATGLTTRGEGDRTPGIASSPEPQGPDTTKAPAPPTEWGMADSGRESAGGSTDTIRMALQVADGSLIIRNASLTVEVRDFVATERLVVPIVDAAGGYVEGSSVSLEGKVRSGWFRVRVPQAKFSEVIGKFEEIGKPISREMGTEDVTAAVIDLEARITNLRRQELRLGELLSQAKNLDEILRVENELNRIRYQIEQSQSQLKWYQGRVTMATIYLHMSEPGAPTTPPVPGADLWYRLWQAFLGTWRGIGRFLEGLVVFVASIIPVALVLGGAWWGWLRYRRNRGYSRQA